MTIKLPVEQHNSRFICFACVISHYNCSCKFFLFLHESSCNMLVWYKLNHVQYVLFHCIYYNECSGTMQDQSHLFTSQEKEGLYRNMATGPPQPNQIPNFPSGELHYLFRKKITRSDMQTGLILIRESNEYLRSLPQTMRDQINAFGLATMCYTPVCNLYVEVGSGPIANNNFRVKKRGWMVIAARNWFNVEDEIDCWALHEAGAGKLSLLIQKVRLIKLTNYYLTKFDIFFLC